jgi:hypothetical protein
MSRASQADSSSAEQNISPFMQTDRPCYSDISALVHKQFVCGHYVLVLSRYPMSCPTV